MLKTVLAFDDNDDDVAAGETTAVLASPAETIADCRARAAVYRLLCGAFVEEPGSAFIAALRTPAALAELAAAGLRFDADFLDSPHDALIEALAIEYTQQFASSGGFPAVESVRLTASRCLPISSASS